MDLFQFLKARLSILDVVGEYVQLKRAGNYYKGNCPIHSERTPSFTVSPHRGIFYCFGCHKGGDAISFIAEVERCTAREAALSLAEHYSIDIPKELTTRTTVDTNDQSGRDRYFATCAAFAQFCTESLKKFSPALEYLMKRGISLKTADRFAVGYFKGGEQGIQSLLKCTRDQGLLAHDFIEAQIIKEGSHGLFSPFEDRIIFPIQNNLGMICGFGGRTFISTDTRPKYTNSHDHPLFTKGAILYGMAQNKKSINRAKTAYLVEGYLDCILMAEAGINTAVATLGTSCTEQHLTTLARHAEKIVVIYDGDTAGNAATVRLAKLCWHIESELRVALLPPGEDPASLIAKKIDILPFLEQTKSIWQFALLQATEKTTGIKGQLDAVRDLLESIIKLNNPLKERIIILELSRSLGISPEELLRSTTNSTKRDDAAVNSEKNVQSEISDLEKSALYAIITGWNKIPDEIKTIMIETVPQPLIRPAIQLGEWFAATPDGNFVVATQQLDFARQAAISHAYAWGEEREISVDECINEFLKKQC